MWELTSTALPEPFELLYYVHVSKRRRAERAAHERLARYRTARRACAT